MKHAPEDGVPELLLPATMLGRCLSGCCSRLMGVPCCRFANIEDKDAIQEKILEKKKVADTAENVSNLVLQFLACTHGGSVWAFAAEGSVPVTCRIDIIRLCTVILVLYDLTILTMIDSHLLPCCRVQQASMPPTLAPSCSSPQRTGPQRALRMAALR